jgi:hypothetical protein
LVALWNPGAFLVRADVFAEVGGYAVPLAFSENSELGMRLGQRLAALGEPPRSTERCLVSVDVPPGSSNALNPRNRYESALYLLSRSDQHLDRDPALRATYGSVAGRAAMKLGDRAAARRLFAAAVRDDWRNPRHWARLAAATLVNR